MTVALVGAVAAGSIAALAPMAAILLIVGAVVGVATLKCPEYLVVFFGLVLPSGSFNPVLRIDSPLGQFNPFSLAILIAATTALVLVPSRSIQGARTGPSVVGVAIVVAGTISAVSSGEAAAFYWVLNGGLVLCGLGVLLGQRYAERPDRLEGAVFLGAAILSASLAIEWFLGDVVSWFGLAQPEVSVLVFRPRGLVGNPLVSSAALAVVLALRLSYEGNRRWRSLESGIYLLGISVSLSRSAVIAAAVVLVAFAVRPGRRLAFGTVGSRGAVIAVAIVVAGVFYRVSSQGIADRLASGLSDVTRLENLQASYGLFLANPLLGLGFGGYKRYALSNIYGDDRSSVATTDNAFLALLVEVGIFGSAIVVLAGLAVWFTHRRIPDAGSALPALAWMVSALFFDAHFHDSMMLLLGVVLLRATNGVACMALTAEKRNGVTVTRASPAVRGHDAEQGAGGLGDGQPGHRRLVRR